MFLLFAWTASPVHAQDEEPPPMPLHAFDGVGGAFTTPHAYLVNPGPEGEIFGKPSVGYIHVHLGAGKHLESLTLTETLGNRVELGYGLNYLDMGDLPEDVERAFGDTVKIHDHAVTLHNLNARLQAIREGDFGTPEMPAVTLGVQWKKNDTIDDLDRDLHGALDKLVGIEDDQGIDVVLTASKFFTEPIPFGVSLTARSTEAAHTGLLGFTGTRRIVGEAQICAMVSDGFDIAAEYKQKPSTYTPVSDLLEDEDDWWTVDVCFIVNSHLTVSAGYGHFGKLLNHRANKVFGFALKFEF